jgi:hypothetical protein
VKEMGEIRKENLHQSLIEHLNGLGLTEDQVNELIENALVEISEKNVEQDEVVNGLVDKVGELNGLMTEEKGDLVGAINEVFQYGVNVKQRLVGILASKGIDCSTSDSFDKLITDIDSMNNIQINSGEDVTLSNAGTSIYSKISKVAVSDTNNVTYFTYTSTFTGKARLVMLASGPSSSDTPMVTELHINNVVYKSNTQTYSNNGTVLAMDFDIKKGDIVSLKCRQSKDDWNHYIQSAAIIVSLV